MTLLAHLHSVPMAHLGHWLWVLYALPILIVVGGIAYTTRVGKRREEEERKR
jgi:hypothetical protein